MVGRPPQEDGPIGKATERIFLPLTKILIPDIVDMDLPAEGVFHNCCIVSIDKRFPKQAQKVMNAVWGAHLLSLSKLIIVVDADCDVHDYREVAWRAFGNVDYAHDMLLTSGPVDHLDHAAYQQFWGGKVGIDATRKLPDRGLSPRRRLAGRVRDDAGDGRSGGRAVVGVRAVSSSWRSAPVVAAPSPVRGFLRLVMIEHSIFALPFAYVAALAAMRSEGPHVQWWTLFVVTVAMVSARTVAMAANRIIDRHIDAQNPRTAGRELVTGVLSVRAAWIGLAISLVVFFVSVTLLGWLCLVLSPIALFFLVIYSYAKRFTDLPQVFLGIAQAIAPVGAWIGVTGTWSWPAVVLGVAVGAWIGGFDCIYACQDVEVDRRIGVRSVPVRFGVAGALRASSVAHVVTVALFVWFGVLAGFGWLWFTGVALTALVLVYEHAIVKPDDLSRVNRAFFTANGVIGILLFVFALADLVLLQNLRRA